MRNHLKNLYEYPSKVFTYLHFKVHCIECDRENYAAKKLQVLIWNNFP